LRAFILLLLFPVLATSLTAARSDPFVATWVYDSQKSPKPTITYGIKNLGGNRFALTGSSGETTEINADGVSIKSPSGATVSFKKLDEHTWQMDRVDARAMVRTYTVSSDNKTLALRDVFTATDGSKDETITTYARRGPGDGIFGEWQSISMQETSSGKPEALVIETFGKDGLSFMSTFDKHRTDMYFDGKEYFDQAPDGTRGDSSSGKRMNAHFIQIDNRVKGRPDGTRELKVSPDGMTLTIVSRPIRSSAVFTSVWDKQ
jgi:hypothetical protein